MNESLEADKSDKFPALSFRKVLNKYTAHGHGSACLPQLKDIDDDNEIIVRLIVAANAPDSSESSKDAKHLLGLAYLSRECEQSERLSQSITQFETSNLKTSNQLIAALKVFNETSVATLTENLQAFISSLEQQATAAGKQSSAQLTQSQWLSLLTAFLAMATLWMAYSTQTLASEAANNMKSSANQERETEIALIVTKQKQKIVDLTKALENCEKSKYTAQTALEAKSLELSRLKSTLLKSKLVH